jgi:hypothetical protein
VTQWINGWWTTDGIVVALQKGHVGGVSWLLCTTGANRGIGLALVPNAKGAAMRYCGVSPFSPELMCWRGSSARWIQA